MKNNDTISNIADELENVGIVLSGLTSTFGSLSVSERFDDRDTNMFLFFEQVMEQTSDQLNAIISELIRAASKI